MNSEEVVIEELNTLLRGTYMDIRSLEHHIQKLDHPELIEKFQSMQQECKDNAKKLAKRIQDLKGVPADSEGVSGRMHSFMHNLTLSNNAEEIIEDALKGLDNYGIHYSEEVVKGDLDEESKRIVEEVIDSNRRHAEDLRQMLH